MNKLLLVCILFSTMLFSCKKFIPLNIEKINDNQLAPLNAELPLPLKIKVLNHKNEAIEGIQVRFFIKNGSGTFSDNSFEFLDTTDAEGFAECRFKLGVEALAQEVEVEIKKYDGESVVFTASPEYYSDSRDGQQYLLTKIGTQIWTAENIRFQSPNAWTNSAFPSSLYGKLYSWNEAQSVCPSGFSLPTRAELETMTTTVGNEYFTIGKKLKSRNGWLHNEEGRNLVGFDLYPAGNYAIDSTDYRGLGEYAAVWTATEVDPQKAVYGVLSYNSPNIYYYNLEKNIACACRCIKNQ
jgi:uncharacterized protein (TIGR02145 family)